MAPKKMNTASFWQRLLVPLFTFVWWRRLSVPHPHFPDQLRRDHVVYVKGWRTALIDEIGCGRKTVTFLFRWEHDMASWDGDGRR